MSPDPDDELIPPLRATGGRRDRTVSDWLPFDEPLEGPQTWSFMVATRSLPETEPFSDARGEWEVINCTLRQASYAMNVTSDASGRASLTNVTVETLDAIPNLRFAHEENHDTANPGSYTDGYYIIMQCGMKLLRGHIIDWGTQTKNIEASTDVTKTSLMFTKEMLFTARLKDVGDGWTVADTIDNHPDAWPSEAYHAPSFNQSLGDTVEELFRNLTLALFSDPAFLQSEGIPTEVAGVVQPNVYSYHYRNFVASYGAALALSLLACIVGIASMCRNGAAYSSRFSTLSRTTRGRMQSFDERLDSDDKSSADPLAKHLATTRIHFAQDDMANDSSGSQIELQQNLHVTPKSSDPDHIASPGDEDRRSEASQVSDPSQSPDRHTMGGSRSSSPIAETSDEVRTSEEMQLLDQHSTGGRVVLSRARSSPGEKMMKYHGLDENHERSFLRSETR